MSRLAPFALTLVALACRTDKTGEDSSPTGGEDEPLDADGDGYDTDADCDDGDAAVNPGAAEVCDGVDNDCDGEIDDGVLETFYVDADDDGYGGATVVEACGQPAGTAANSDDSDDGDADTYPGAPERCDDADNDCDGATDEDVVGTWYADADDDGWGDAAEPFESCDPPPGYVAEAGDCDDLDASAYPDAPEVCDEADNDCDGGVDEDVTLTWFADADGDGFGDAASTTEACEAPEGYIADATDCDDTDASVSPRGVEVCDEADTDEDCDGAADDDDDDALGAATVYQDADGDGFGDARTPQRACDPGSTWVSDDNDCDDGSAEVNPDADEVCNGIDDDCNGVVDDDTATDAATWYADGDRDGYGTSAVSTVACDVPTGFTDNGQDCDDGDATANPGEAEVCDGVDNDCDGDVDEDVTTTWYLDYDGDGYGDDARAAGGCEAPTGDYVATGGDCDDDDPAFSPAATEGCDGLDHDCDGDVDNDADGDGYSDAACGGDDCDDGDATVLPEHDGGCAVGADCQDILDAGRSVGDDTYTIDPDGYVRLSTTFHPETPNDQVEAVSCQV